MPPRRRKTKEYIAAPGAPDEAKRAKAIASAKSRRATPSRRVMPRAFRRGRPPAQQAAGIWRLLAIIFSLPRMRYAMIILVYSFNVDLLRGLLHFSLKLPTMVDDDAPISSLAILQLPCVTTFHALFTAFVASPAYSISFISRVHISRERAL